MRTVSELVQSGEKAGISYGWTTTDAPSRLPRSKSVRILWKYLKLYCEYSSLVGYKYLIESRRNWVERIIWFLIHLTCMCALSFIIYGVYMEYLITPVATVVGNNHYPTYQLAFPAVAICTINRISREAAARMASEVSNVTNLSADEILVQLGYLGILYDSTVMPDESHLLELDRTLTAFYGGHYDVTEIMKQLTPNCSAGLFSCRYRGIVYNCNDLFTFRKTQDGFCCTFNYVREKDDMKENTKTKLGKPHRVNSMGIENGLTLVLEPFLNDYFYPILPVFGWKVTIFNPTDYPDTRSGGVSEVLIAPLSETFIEIDAISFYSTADIRSFPVSKRKCLFNDDDTALFNTYTYSDCIVDCKLTEIQDTCGCKPFYVPRRGSVEYSRKICDLKDAHCLHRNKSKWNLNDDDHSKDFENESGRSLSCEHCQPSCDDLHYVVRSSTATLVPGLYETELLAKVKVTEQSLMHIYFSKYGTLRLKQDAVYRWYELLSNIGGICGVFIGFSLISVVEIGYFFILMLVKQCRQCGQLNRQIDIGIVNENTIPVLERSTMPPLYWNELEPSNRVPSIYQRSRQNRSRRKY